jgi:PKD repeat protein
VTLDASNAGGSSTHMETVTVATVPPVANFTFTPALPAAGQAVQFSDTSTGAPTTWSWTFGDPDSGASNASASRNPSHVFAKPGLYTVTLDASNAGGTGLRNHAVTVAASSPVANFTYMPPTPSIGETVQFTDSTSGGPTAWSWDFGDPGSGASNTSTLQNPTHVFARSGVYPLTLTVSNAEGTGTRTMNMTIQCSRCTRVVNFR